MNSKATSEAFDDLNTTLTLVAAVDGLLAADEALSAAERAEQAALEALAGLPEFVAYQEAQAARLEVKVSYDAAKDAIGKAAVACWQATNATKLYGVNVNMRKVVTPYDEAAAFKFALETSPLTMLKLDKTAFERDAKDGRFGAFAPDWLHVETHPQPMIQWKAIGIERR